MKLKIFLGVLALAVLGYPLAAATTGLFVRLMMQSDEQQFFKLAPYLTLLRSDYHEGIYRSTELLSFGPAQPSKTVLTGGRAAGPPSFEITVRHVIQHGPFPHLKSVALALIDTRLVLPPAVEQDLRPLLNGTPPLQMQTRVSWLGRADTTLTSPAFVATAAGNQTSVAWRGIVGHFSHGPHFSFLSGEFSSEGLTIRSPSLQFALSGLHARVNSHRALTQLSSGSSSVSLNAIELTPVGTGSPFSVEGLKFTSTTALDGAFYGGDLHLTADSLQAASFSVSKAEYSASVKHLHAASLDALMAVSQDDGSQPGASRTSLATAMDSVRQNGFEILLHDPVVAVQHLGFQTPQGQLDLAGTLTLSGLTRKELESATGVVIVIKRVHAAFDLQVDEALMTRLAASSGKGSLVNGQIKSYESQGYLRTDHGKLTTHIDFRDGRLMLNGKLFSPTRDSALQP